MSSQTSFYNLIYPFVDEISAFFNVGDFLDYDGFPFAEVALVASSFLVLFGLFYCFRRVFRASKVVK